jgi:hypothetical protein
MSSEFIARVRGGRSGRDLGATAMRPFMRLRRAPLALLLTVGVVANCARPPPGPAWSPPPLVADGGVAGVFLLNESFDAIPTDGKPVGWRIDGGGGAVAVAEVPFAANKSLSLSRTGATDASATVTFPPASGRVVVEAKVKAMTAAGPEYLPVILGADGVTPVVTVAFEDGNITSSIGATRKTVQTFDVATWYMVRATIDTAAQTYKLSIDATLVLAGAAVQSNASSVAGLRFDVADRAGSSYVDDVHVYELGAFVGAPPAPVYDAKAHGATGDGTTKDTTALQATIDSVPASGGTVLLHDGTFLTGTLVLKSNLTLYIDPTATLMASSEAPDFPEQSPPTHNVNLKDCRRAVLYAQGASHVTIDGGGTIDGNGSLPQYAVTANGTEVKRPILFWPVQCSHITVRNVSFHDGAVWGIVPTESSQVTIDNVYVDSTSTGNRDGIDIVDSSDVTIEHTVLHTEDDAICPKSGVADGVQRLVVHDTAITKSTHANGIKFGTVSYGSLRDSTFTDVLIKNVGKGGISLESADGADVTNIIFQRIEIDRSGAPLFAVIENRGLAPGSAPRRIGSVDGVRYIDIRATNTTSNDGASFVGLLQDGVRHPLRNLSFENVDVAFPGGENSVPPAPKEPGDGYPEYDMFRTLPASTYYFRHVDGLSFTHSRATVATTDARPLTMFVDVP